MSSDNWSQLKKLFHFAVELKSAERPEFLDQACGNDLDLRAAVERLLASHEQAGSFLISPALVDAGVITELDPGPEVEVLERVGHRIGPYEIIREIGHGGMGTVYLAVRADDQYRKYVAVKLVNRGMNTDVIVRRFMMERQILANLEHQNIARLLEGGATTDGLPYFVMEFVDGQPIDDFCDEHRFTTTERLKLFREVCAALQYAHQNLVIHRDIKPGNILVTADGTPKLLDFGIAKLLSPDWAAETGEATLTMQQLMTPAYASPEQLRGQRITTASDIYSLGVVLYELLSGHRPYSLNGSYPEETAEAVLREEPLKPSVAVTRPVKTSSSQSQPAIITPELIGQNRDGTIDKLRRRLSGDLDNIVLKALRKEPERRYASVQELAEDIRRNLVGLPVNASPDTFSYRAKKFIQRNKAAAIAVAVVVVTLCAATAVTGWQARLARRERDKAQHRFSQVRKLANSVLFDYHDGIEKLPGSTPVREKMVKDALEYLDNLSSESGGDPGLQSELAQAYEKVGDVQGNPYGANLGNQEGALISYRKAVALRESLFAANPADLNIKLDLAQSYKNVADILWARGDNGAALEHYQKALAMFEALVPTDPKNTLYLSSVNTTLNGIANVQTQSGKFNEALDTYRKSLSKAEALYATDATSKANIRNVAVANLKVGDALMHLSDCAGALPKYEKSVELFTALAGSDHTNAPASRDLGLSYSRVASANSILGRYDKAVESNFKALEQQRKILAADPTNAQAQFDIATTHRNIGESYLQTKQLENAATNIREALKIFNQALDKNSSFLQARGNLGATYISYAEVLLARNDLAGSEENFRHALTILEQEPLRSAKTSELAYAYESLGDLEMQVAKSSQRSQQSDHFQNAKLWFQKTSDLRRKLSEQNPGGQEDKAEIDGLNRKIGLCETALAKPRL